MKLYQSQRTKPQAKLTFNKVDLHKFFLCRRHAKDVHLGTLLQIINLSINML